MGGFLRKTFGQLRQGEGPAQSVVAAAVPAAAPVPVHTIASTMFKTPTAKISAGVKVPTLIAGRSTIKTTPQGVVDEELKLKKRKLGAGKAT